MSSSSYYFGADGGGTKTLGILADADGRTVARHQVGASNPNVVGVDGAAKGLVALLVACCETARCTPEDIQAAVIGLAGAGSTLIRDRLIAALTAGLSGRTGSCPACFIETDARIALEGAFAGGPGVILIAGTGSIVLGKDQEGQILRVGGWGRILGDEGSGYFLGLEALKAVAAEIDGTGTPTSLRAALREQFGWATREEIIVPVYQENFTIPSLAPLVLETAERGDGVSRDILVRGSELLAGQVAAMAARLHGDKPVGVVFVGGLIDHDTLYARMVHDALGRHAPGVQVASPMLTPAEGAVLMARAYGGKQ